MYIFMLTGMYVEISVFCLSYFVYLFLFIIFQPQTAPGQTPAQQPVVQLPMGGVQPGAVIQPQVPSSQPTAMPMVAPAPQYQWYQQMPPAVGSVATSTPLAQTTPLQGTHVQ